MNSISTDFGQSLVLDAVLREFWLEWKRVLTEMDTPKSDQTQYFV